MRAAFFLAVSLATTAAQDNIPYLGEAYAIRAVARLPDSGSGSEAPARVSLVTEDPTGRLFASDQRGVIHQVDPLRGSVRPYLDLRNQLFNPVVQGNGEAGLHSFAFHPDFFRAGAEGFGKLYTLHSTTNTRPAPDFDPGGGSVFHEVLLEWRTKEPARVPFHPASGGRPFREVMRFSQPFSNHNGGLIAFDPSARQNSPAARLLYLALGDGGSGGDPQRNAQNPSNPYGAILRIDPLASAGKAYRIVRANHFAADGNPRTIPELYSIGLRNPQRFGWDLVSRRLFIADIGQDTFEEVNIGRNGGNFGWNLREGNGPRPFLNPVTGFGHTDRFANTDPEIGNRAVTISDPARGTCIRGLDGKLLVADFPTGVVFRAHLDRARLDGTNHALREVRFRIPGRPALRFLDHVNKARADRGLPASGRADIRFSSGTPGRIFVSSKHDGILRQIVPDQQPFARVAANGTIRYRGILQSSSDRRTWRTVVPQPRQGARVPAKLRYRAILHH